MEAMETLASWYSRLVVEIFRRPYHLSGVIRTTAAPSLSSTLVIPRISLMNSPRLASSSSGFGSAMGIAILSNGVSSGLSGATRPPGEPSRTIAPLSFPLYWSRSVRLSALMPITCPRTAPLVAGDQPKAASVNWCSAGLTIRPVAVPRFQAFCMVHGSRWAFGNPATLNCSSVQWLVWATVPSFLYGPRIQMGLRQSCDFELLFGPVAGLVQFG